MKKVWMGILLIGIATLLPAPTRADIKCVAEQGCGSCNAGELIQYSDPDGNNY